MHDNEMIQHLEEIQRVVSEREDRLREESMCFERRFSKIICRLIIQIEHGQKQMIEALQSESTAKALNNIMREAI